MLQWTWECRALFKVLISVPVDSSGMWKVLCVIFDFLRNCYTVFPVNWLYKFIFLPAIYEFLLLYIFLDIWYCCNLEFSSSDECTAIDFPWTPSWSLLSSKKDGRPNIYNHKVRKILGEKSTVCYEGKWQEWLDLGWRERPCSEILWERQKLRLRC